MQILFEQGTMEHLDELEKLYDDLNDHLNQTVNYPGWIKGFYPVRQTALDGIEEKCLYILTIDGLIVASVIIRNTPEEAYHGVKWLTADDYNKIAVLYTYVVHPEYLKQGFGLRLMEHIIEACTRQGVRSIRLDVYEKNLPAVKLYEKCGFQYIDAVDLGWADYGLDQFLLYEYINFPE